MIKSDYLGPYLLGPNDMPENGIYTGDARELAKAIPDESVDLIFTDPVYNRIDDYHWLAQMGARVLKVGANLLAQSNKQRLSDKLTSMSGCGLDWQTMIAEVYSLACGTLGGSRTMKGWQPYLWYSKGRRCGDWCFDRLITRRNRRWHKWGDGVELFLTYIPLLTGENAVVFDPFTGGGTVPAVCKMLGRRYLAFEIEPDVAEMARERVRNTQPPLFVPQPEQLEMEICNDQNDR